MTAFQLESVAVGTPRLLIPMWVAALALHGVVGLYWYSIGPEDYRFPMPAGALLFATGIAAIAWWWVRAQRTGRTLVSTRAQLRHRRMALFIAYGLACAAAALPAGISGNDLAWHRFTDADPQIVPAEATSVGDVVQRKVGTTAYYSGTVDLDGERFPFKDEPVRFGGHVNETDPAVVELWAVFAPANLDAGFVLVSDPSDAEGMLEHPVLPLLPVGLVLAACCWAVQHLRLRPWKFPERTLRPLDEVPSLLWKLFAIPCVLWSSGLTIVAVRASADVPFQASTGYGLDFTGPILVWMLLLLPGVAYFAAFFHSTATNRIYPVWKPRQMRR